MPESRDSAQPRQPEQQRPTDQDRLSAYVRPSVAVDTAVLTVADGTLCVVLVNHDAGSRLPGTFVHEGETLAAAVLRSLRDKAGIEGLRPRQLYVFDGPHRDTRGWVMSVAHLVTVPAASVAQSVLAAGAELRPWQHAHDLDFDHDQIVRMAVDRLRLEYRNSPDPERLLGAEFTLYDLLRLHEAVAGHPLGKDTFRRHMRDQLVETDAYQPGVVGKPAKLFRHR